jgi:hypothetical protein
MWKKWRPVVGYYGYYEVSNLGNVRSLARVVVDNIGRRRIFDARMLSTNALVKGYRSVALWADNEGERVYVHRVVLEAFVGPCPSGMECRHEDGDRLNPRLTNLSWGTPKQNGEDRVAHGKQARHEWHGMSTLTTEIVYEIRGMLGTMTQARIARKFGISQTAVSDIKTGRRWAGA